MNDKFHLRIELEQYTPLLQFQGSTEGACLRASEVKPKLDAFVLQQLGDACRPEWKLETTAGHEPALCYKMRFTAKGKVQIFSNYKDKNRANEIHPLYFASMGNGNSENWLQDGSSRVKGVYYTDGMTMTLISPRFPELLEKIEPLLPAFFALHGFGTRSNKGFGSFGVKEKPVCTEGLLPVGCETVFDLRSNARLYDMNDQLNDIYVLSSLIKGGYNHKKYGCYHGYIRTVLPKGIGTDKAFIKQRVFNDKEKKWYQSLCWTENRERTVPSDYRYIRAMLGLCDAYPFGVGGDALKINVVAADGEIKRFHNPVQYRPYRNGIRVVVYRIPEVMWNQEFRFRGESICTPSKEDFSLTQFVRNFLRSTLKQNGDIYRGDIYRKVCEKKPKMTFKMQGAKEQVIISYEETVQRLSLMKGGI